MLAAAAILSPDRAAAQRVAISDPASDNDCRSILPEGTMPKLEETQVEGRLKALQGWERRGDEIRKEYKFRDFRAAMAFVNKVADAAEAVDHHPDIVISYNRVTMTLSTHSEGGLTEKDFDLAPKIDAAA
jgi:4a-hydroxytetrahydrobiopterin dehydratase